MEWKHLTDDKSVALYILGHVKVFGWSVGGNLDEKVDSIMCKSENLKVTMALGLRQSN